MLLRSIWGDRLKSVYKTRGTCCKFIEVEVIGGIVKDVNFSGGCDGSLQGVARLVKGMHINKVIDQLGGITCGSKNTSCPDQLAKALKFAKASQ